MEVKRYSVTAPLQTTKPLGSTKALETLAREEQGKSRTQQSLDTSQASGINLQALEWGDELTPEVMKELDKLAGMELALGIDRDELINAILDNLRNPESISQGDRQTCSATVVQMTLAREDPAEYVRLMAGLASPKGEVKLRDGSILKRDPNYQLGNGKSLSDKLLQPALMQKATKGGYDSRNDRRLDGKGQGLYAAEQAKLLESLTGRKTETIFGNDDELLAQVKVSLQSGNHVSATIKVTDPKTGETKGHSVLIEKMEHGLITYLDPNKGRVTMPLEKFKGSLESVNLPSECLTPSLKARAKQDGSVAGFFSISLPNPLDALKKAGEAMVQVAKDTAGAVVQVAKDTVGAAGQMINNLGQGIKDGVGAIGETANQVIGAAGQAIQEGVKTVGKVIQDGVTTVGEIVKDRFEVVKDFVVSEVNRRIDFGKMIFDNVSKFIKDVREKAEKAINEGMERLKEFGEGAKKFWDQYGGLVVAGVSAVCMVVPGLQVVSLGLAIYQAVQGGAEMIEGIKTNDWKRALGGAASMLSAVAGGAAAGGLKAFGSAAKTVADLAKQGSQICNGIVTAMDAIEAKDPGKLLGVLVKGAGGAAMKIGNGLDKIAEQGLQIYEKCEKYGSKLQKAYDAFSSGDILGGLSVTVSAAASANSEFGGDAALSDGLEKASKVTRTIGSIKNAADKRDFGGVIGGLEALGTELNLSMPQLQIDPKVMEGINQGVKLGDKVVKFTEAVNSGDPQRIKAAGLDLAESTRVMDSNTRQRLDKVADKSIQLGQMLQRGDYGGAALTALDLSVDTGVVSEKDAKGLLDTTRKVGNLAKAVNSGDPQALMAATKDLGLLDQETEKSINRLVPTARGLKDAYDRKDFGALANMATDLAVEGGVLSDGDRRNLQATVKQGDTLLKNIQAGRYEEAAKQLGVPQDVIQKYTEGKALYENAVQGDIGSFAKQMGIPQEHIEMVQHGLNLSNAIRNGDFETVEKEAGLMGLQAQVLNHPAVKSAQDQLKRLAELKSAVRKGDFSVAQPLLEKFGPLPELPQSKTLSAMYSQLTQAVNGESPKVVSELSKKVAEMAGVLDHPAVKEVREFSSKLEEAQGKLEGMDSQAIMRYLSDLFREGNSQVAAR